jgi:hypothetical protein
MRAVGETLLGLAVLVALVLVFFGAGRLLYRLDWAPGVDKKDKLMLACVGFLALFGVFWLLWGAYLLGHVLVGQ